MGGVQAVLAFGGRVGLAVGLALVLSMLGVALAWGIFIFSGAVSKTTMLWLVMSGAGLGAGVGATLPWLRVDGNSILAIIATVSLTVLAGLGGAWGGYQYSADREVACCTKPDIAPFTYAAFGAVAMANGTAFLCSIAREGFAGRRRPVSRQF